MKVSNPVDPDKGATRTARLKRAMASVFESLEGRRLFAVTVGNNSFETPRMMPGTNSYTYDPTGATWTFTGNAGIEHNGSAFNAVNAPDGMQAAFLQSNVTAGQDAIGVFSQALTFSATGTYDVTFDAAQRTNKSVLPISVQVDGVQVGSTISPASTAWAAYTTAQFTISTTGSHTLKFTGVDSTAADLDSFIDLVAVVSVSPPTIATAAAATPSPVTGLTTALSVLGADSAGESTLTYTWSTTGSPPAAVTFSANGTNSSKSTTATFTKAGAYSFLVTVTDTNGLTATSSVNVTVNQTAKNITVTPTSASMLVNATQQFAASELDQFGNAMTTQPSFVWSNTGVGSISSAGLYTAPANTGSATITATAGGFTSNSAAVTVVTEGPPTVATAAAVNPSPVTGTTAGLSVLGADLAGESTLTYTWSLTGTIPAAVTYLVNGTNAAKNTTATFTVAGTYNFLVTITNDIGLTTTSSVSVVVSQTINSIVITPGSASIAVNGTQQYAAVAFDQFGNVLTTQPAFTWTTAGDTGATGSTAIGSISASTGLYTASTLAGMATVTATAGNVYSTVPTTVGGATIANGTVTLSTFGTSGAYTTVDTNSCAIAVDNLWTDAGSKYQFGAYYTATSEIMIGRRQIGSSNWQLYDSGIADSTISDDHDVISIAVDSAGYMHMSWGMHNISLNYAISNTVVTGTTLSALTFTIETATNAPSLFPASGATTNEVTYPQFYLIPNSTNLMFAYRNGGAGGGSGNGNEYIDVYTPATKTWTNNFFINGELTSVNAYLNRMVFDTSGNLLTSWTWRATANWQTNSNIMFAQSPDDGVSWYQQGGTTQYALPIIQSGTPTASVAQVVETIPENSSFINQTSMTVDQNNNPIIATYLAPGTSSSNYNLQYMVYYYYNGQWRTTQVSSRTSDTALDSSGADVRDLGRPIVLVDKQGRVLVVTRSEDTSMGAYSSSTTPNNDIVVYYSTNFASGSPTWNSVTLNVANMGDYEPTYDQNLWTSNNELSMFYEPVGRSGLTTGVVQTMDWNEQAYFYNITPTVSTAAAANPTPVSGTSTRLTVLGADAAGEASLTYTWSLTGMPPASVSFTDNADGTAKNTTANFTAAGTYNFVVTIADSSGLSTTSPVSVVVNQTLTAVKLSPSVVVTAGTSQATATDQFSNALTNPNWTVSNGGGSITTTGLFTSGTTGGSFTITATSGTVSIGTIISVVPTAYIGSVGNDTYALRLNPADTTLEQIFVNTPENGLPTYTIPMSQLSTLSFLTASDGSVTVDYVNGNSLPAGGISYNGGSGLYIKGSPAGAMTFTINGTQVVNQAAPAAPIIYTSLQTIGFSLTGGSNTLIQQAQPAAVTTYNAGSGSNTLTINAGSFTFITDPQLGSGNLTVNDNASVIFNPPAGGGYTAQNLFALNLGSTATATVTPTTTTDRTVLETTNLSITSGGTLDLGNNAMIVHSSTAATIGNLVGTGIISSSANSDTTFRTAIGVIVNSNSGAALYTSFENQPVTASDVLVKYTYYGDANLDGKVDGTDYSRIDSGFLSQATGWFNGDFNNDGKIDGSDYTLIDNAFNSQSATIAARVAATPATGARPFSNIAINSEIASSANSNDWLTPESKKRKHFFWDNSPMVGNATS